MTNTSFDITPPHPADVFMHLIVAFLAPMFLATTGGDANAARMAAIHTVSAYAARNPTQLLAIAQVIALGLAVLSSVSLSMADTLSIPLVLRLRGNAGSLHRAAETCRRGLDAEAAPQPDYDEHAERQRQEDALAGVRRAEQRLAQFQAAARQTPRVSTPAQPAPKAVPQPRREPTPPAEALLPSRPATAEQAQVRHNIWAAAMTQVARECAEDIAHLPPAQRRQATMRAAALSSVAHELLSG